MRDLRLRAGDEEAEDVGGDALLRGRERAERFERWFSTIRCAPPSCSSLARVEVAPARLDRRAPEPLEHELQERRLDGSAGAAAPASLPAPLPAQREPRRRRPPRAPRRPAPARLVRLLARRQTAIPLGYRPLDRLPGSVAVEVVDAEVVREQVRDASLEAVELRPRVLADREQDVHAQVGRR